MLKKIIFALILVVFTMLVVSCDNKTDPNIEDEKCNSHIDKNDDNLCDNCGETIDVIITPDINLIAVNERISLKDLEVNDFDYKTLFTITVNGETIPVVDSYIDLTQVSDTLGTFEVICNYDGKSAKVYVDVIETIYEVTLATEEITIYKYFVDEYDYLSFFTAKIDGVIIEITNDMINNNVKAEEGKYEFTVTNNKVSKTLIVNVINYNKIEIINTYNNLEIYYNELTTFDYTSLFAVYINDKAIEVTMDMIDISALENAIIGETYEISLTCLTEENDLTKTISVKVLEGKELSISAKNLIIYPNAEYIDLCSLFEIKYGDEIVPVTIDMISGTINYTNVGINEITLNYKGIQKTATVEVKKGVVINHRYGDTITIKKGTNQNYYSFINDFIVVVNGVEMNMISESYLDLTTVDFNTAGTYEVKLIIPYNENKVTLTGVKFSYYEETITYVVVENDYEITVLKDLVELKEGTTDYDPFKNIKVRINGKNQSLTENANWASPIACYVQIVSDSIDFNKSGNQEVVIAIYVNGPESEPVHVSYNVAIKTNIVVESINNVVYTGDTLYTRDLFKISNGDSIIDVTNDMINGHVNTFKPGVYFVNINYAGIERTAKVVVLDRNIIGTYKTLQTSIPTTEVNESDEEVTTAGKVLDNLVISEDGTLKIGSRTATITDAIDENTFNIKLRSYDYTLHYANGIIILNPENNIKLEFNEDKRPLIYFNSDLWSIIDTITINSKNEHVLTYGYPCYSIDAFKIQSNLDYTQKWYGLKVEMTSKMNSDTIYDVSWGELVFADDFIYDINQQSTVTFNDVRYSFKINGKKTAKIYDDVDTNKYLNKTFTGTYNGQPASLYIDYYGAYTFKVNSEKVFYISKYDVEQLKIGGADYIEDIVLLYDLNEIYSYKFNLDLENNTFTFVDKELTFGKYMFNNYMFFFDGYGTGIFKDDVKSYYQYPFTYKTNGKEIELEFIKPVDDFEYGDVINLYLDDFGNILTIGSCDKEGLIGVTLENQNITDGAIIRVNTKKIGSNTDTLGKKELYDKIEIITKDGIVSGDAIKNYVNTSAIRFSVPGFYQFSISIDVNGTTLTSYYGLQILNSIYENNDLIGNYTGITNENTKLSIDKYGISRIMYAGTSYEGMAKIMEDKSFVITAYSDTKNKIQVTGTMIKNGIISIRSTGAVTFNEYLTTGSINIIGCEGTFLRMIQVGNDITYALSANKTSFGSIVDVEILDGNSILNTDAIVRLYNEQEKIVKISSWGNTTSGLTLNDGYRGNYFLNEQEELFLDGFGKVIYQNQTGLYDLNSNVITFEIDRTTYVCQLYIESNTYEHVDIKLDNTLVLGKTFSSSYIFYCSDYAYTANTSFEFNDNGVVVIKSASSDHNSGDEMCSNDLYSPLFASSEGVNGTFTVSGNKIKISIDSIEFIFKINNVLNVEEIVCQSTNLDSESHGYFAVDTIFTKK